MLPAKTGGVGFGSDGGRGDILELVKPSVRRHVLFLKQTADEFHRLLKPGIAFGLCDSKAFKLMRKKHAGKADF